jgi:hypothetical protein
MGWIGCRPAGPSMIRPDARLGASAPPIHGFAWRSRVAVRGGSASVFLLSLAGYLAVGGLLVFRGGFIVPDAWSRVGNAAWMIVSRDPHFAAIGFVWNPLPSLVALPLVAIRGLWPPLVTAGFAGNVVSAGSMAGCVVLMTWIAADLGLRRRTATVLVVLFALDPMIVLYGANGMSEALFTFFLLLVARYLLLWWRVETTYTLAAAGLALALAYLTRYEAVAAAGGVLLLIGVRAYQRSSGAWRVRMSSAAADMLVAGLPVGFVLLAWATTSWIITGNAFETLTSTYGSSAQFALAGSSIAAVTGHGAEALRYALGQILGVAPGLPVLIGLAAVVAARRRSLDLLVPLAVFGSVLAFTILTTVGGASFAWLRFSIAAIPLAIVLAMLAVAPRLGVPRAASTRQDDVLEPLGRPDAGHPFGRSRRVVARTSRFAFSIGVIALVAISLPLGLATMTDTHTGREETDQVRAIVSGYDPTMPSVQPSEVGAAAAQYLDALALPDGSVVVDVAIGFPIVLQSSRPRQFVITPDRDFERVLADPTAFGARYLLVPSGSGYSSLDAVAHAYPNLLDDGGGAARLVDQFGSGAFAWRLYEVD